MNRPLQDQIAGIVASREIDIVMLAECAMAPQQIEAVLNRGAVQDFRFFSSEVASAKTLLFSRSEKSILVNQFDDFNGRLTIRRLQISGVPDILLAAVHFQSKRNSSDTDQTLLATILSENIKQVERDTGISRTLLVGDLNMNPFDSGVSGAQGLHAVMTKELARLGSRIVDGIPYPFFYNPMWGHFGDRTTGPPGTYHLSSSQPLNYFWNIYDQVLLRPDLMDSLRNLQILDSDGTQALVTQRGKPHRSAASDHLPIFFQLEL